MSYKVTKLQHYKFSIFSGNRGGFTNVSHNNAGGGGSVGHNHVPQHRSSSSLSLTSCGSSSYFESASARKLSVVFQRADIFLLCYKISDPSTLFSALNFWCPEIRSHVTSTPIILVGCQSDMR